MKLIGIFLRPRQCLFPDLPLAEQPDYMLYWETLRSDGPLTWRPHESGKTNDLRPQACSAPGDPLVLDHAIFASTPGSTATAG